jgi:hypothetical protein
VTDELRCFRESANLYNYVVTQASDFWEAVNLRADRLLVGGEKAASALPNTAGNFDV